MRTLTLYHRTTPEIAEKIYAEKRMISKYPTHEVYFSDVIDGHASEYGTGIVCVVIPANIATLDDYFPNGEGHYAVHVSAIRPEHFRIIENRQER